MNEEILQRLRDPQLRVALRGYDRMEVDALLSEIAGQIEAGKVGAPAEQAGAGALPGISERVDAIVKAATEAAEHLGAESEKRAAELTTEAEKEAAHARREADDYAAKTRKSADSYADETRSAADKEAGEVREETTRMSEAAASAAEQQAAEILREAELERDRVKASISGLREQRRQVIESIERLRGNLGSMVGNVEQGTEQFIAVDDAEDDELETVVYEDEEGELLEAETGEESVYYEDEDEDDEAPVAEPAEEGFETDERELEADEEYETGEEAYETGEEAIESEGPETEDYDRVEQHADEEWIGGEPGGNDAGEAETELLGDEPDTEPGAAEGDTELFELREDDRGRT